MTLSRPYIRTVRQLVDGSYRNSGHGRYVEHPVYARDADKYVRAFLLLQKDLLTIFDYIAAADTNLPAYSFRTHELLMRACIEVEANFNGILRDNGYAKASNFNMSDFHKVEPTHRLSGYKVKVPYWEGAQSVRRPFASFKLEPGQKPSPNWYRAYNSTKHDRHENFANANLESALDAVAGLVVLLSAQYMGEDFSSRSIRFVSESPFENASGVVSAVH